MEKIQLTPLRKAVGVTALGLGALAVIIAASALVLDISLPYRIGPGDYPRFLWVGRLAAVSLAVVIPALVLGIGSRQGLAVGLALLAPVFLVFIGGAHSGPSPRTWCYNNLRQIDAAKEQLALNDNLTNGVLVTAQQISPYLTAGFDGLRCANQGKYTINPTAMEPRCSIHGSMSEMRAGFSGR